MCVKLVVSGLLGLQNLGCAFLFQKPLFAKREAGKCRLPYFSMGLKYMWQGAHGAQLLAEVSVQIEKKKNVG